MINALQAVSQDPWNSARLTVLYGSNISFNFNTLDKIKNGIEVVNGTVLGISLVDKMEIGHDLDGFELNFRSFNSQANIKGDFYTLPLNRIRVKAENAIGLDTGTPNPDGYQNLSTDWINLFSYTDATVDTLKLDWANYQLNISYECGKPLSVGGNGSLMGEEPDYYAVEIELELVPAGPGF
jgi:hypothetical protein